MIGYAQSLVPAGPAHRTYRHDIDGLRAVAVISVVMFHAGIFPFSSGFVGVDIFFVISGYLIGGIIIRDVYSGLFSFANFYARRIVRIFPALLFLIFSICSISYFLLDAREFKDVGITGTLALIGASNINFWQFQDYFKSDARIRVFLMTWSLGVEEQFYLLFPFLLIFIGRFARQYLGAILLMMTCCSFVTSLWLTWHAPAAAFYLLPARAWELGIGVIFAADEAKTIRGDSTSIVSLLRLQDSFAVIGLTFILVAVVGFDEHTSFPGFLAILPTLGTALLIASPKSVLNRWILASKPMVAVGLISYSWYLWHWPMFALLRIILPTPPTRAMLGFTAIVSLGLAVLSWQCVENPFRKGRPASGRTLLYYTPAFAIVISLPILIQRTGGVPSRLTADTRTIENQIDPGRMERCLIREGGKVTDVSACMSRPSGKPVVALFGDSHAWALGPGLAKISKDRGFGYEILTKGSCAPLTGISMLHRINPIRASDCAAFNIASVQKIVSDPSVTTVVLGGHWAAAVDGLSDVSDTDHTMNVSALDLFRDGLIRTLSALTAAHKHVILFQDVPTWSFDPSRVALAKHIPLRGALVALLSSGDLNDTLLSASFVRRDDIRKIIFDIVGTFDKIAIVDPIPAFCSAQNCLFSLNGNTLFIDDNHLSVFGSEIATRDLKLGDE